MIRALSVAALIALTGASEAHGRAVDGLPLAPVSREDWRAVGVGGTGCWWRAAGDRRWRFAMSDRIAAARVSGRVRVLAPDRGARDLFPFVVDRWRGGGIVVRLLSMGAGQQIESETMRMATRLAVTVRGRRMVYDGVMECGS